MNIRRARLATIWMTAIVAIVTTAATIMAFVLVGIVLTSMPLGVDVRLFYGDAVSILDSVHCTQNVFHKTDSLLVVDDVGCYDCILLCRY